MHVAIVQLTNVDRHVAGRLNRGGVVVDDGGFANRDVVGAGDAAECTTDAHVAQADEA